MSAFIVSNEHIRTMIWAGFTFIHPGSELRWHASDSEIESNGPLGVMKNFGQSYRSLTPATASTVGQILLTANVHSVNHRYDEETLAPYDHGNPSRIQWSAVDILKAIDGYEYQSCEHPEWEISEAREFCEALRATAIRRLPGYDTAPWTINEGSNA